MYILIAILLIIVVIFGVSSGMQSYATAQQAQAQIETAKVAQVSAWGNLITILMMALLIVLTLAVIALVLWVMWKRSAISHQHSASGPRSMAAPREGPPLTINDLMQLEMLKYLRALNPPAAPALQDRHTQDMEELPGENLFPWLR